MNSSLSFPVMTGRNANPRLALFYLSMYLHSAFQLFLSDPIAKIRKFFWDVMKATTVSQIQITFFRSQDCLHVSNQSSFQPEVP